MPTGTSPILRALSSLCQSEILYVSRNGHLKEQPASNVGMEVVERTLGLRVIIVDGSKVFTGGAVVSALSSC